TFAKTAAHGAPPLAASLMRSRERKKAIKSLWRELPADTQARRLNSSQCKAPSLSTHPGTSFAPGDRAMPHVTHSLSRLWPVLASCISLSGCYSYYNYDALPDDSGTAPVPENTDSDAGSAAQDAGTIGAGTDGGALAADSDAGPLASARASFFAKVAPI